MRRETGTDAEESVMVRWSKRGLFVSLMVFALAGCGGGGDGSSDSLDTGGLRVPSSPARAIAEDLAGPFGLTFDRAGNLYIGSIEGTITRISPSGDRELWVETGHVLAGLATGPQDEIFAAAPNVGQVLAISQGRAIRIATSGLDTPTAIVFDRNQRAIVSARGLRGSPQIAVIEIDATYHTLTNEIRSPTGMAFAPNGRLHITDTERNRVVSFQLDRFGEAGAVSVSASGIELPTGIAFDEKGDMFVTGGNRIWTVRPEGNELEGYVVSGDLDYPASLAFGFGINRNPQQLFFTNYGFPLGSGTTVSLTDVGIDGRHLFAP